MARADPALGCIQRNWIVAWVLPGILSAFPTGLSLNSTCSWILQRPTSIFCRRIIRYLSILAARNCQGAFQPSFPVLHFHSLHRGQPMPFLREEAAFPTPRPCHIFAASTANAWKYHTIYPHAFAVEAGATYIMYILCILYMILPFYCIPMSVFWQRKLDFFVQYHQRAS